MVIIKWLVDCRDGECIGGKTSRRVCFSFTHSFLSRTMVLISNVTDQYLIGEDGKVIFTKQRLD